MSNLTSIVELRFEGQEVFFRTIALMLQSMFYGIHVILIPVALHLLMKREKLRLNVYHFGAMLLPFVLSSLYWALEFAEQLERIQAYMLGSAKRQDRNLTAYDTLFNAIILVNYLVSDGIVVWRAWTLCRDRYPRAIWIPEALLFMTILSVFGTIGVRIATFYTTAGPGASDSHPLIKTINGLQVANLFGSLFTNVSATCIISRMAWRHRQLIAGLQNIPNKGAMVEGVLVLLVESGILYCASALTVMVLTLIKLPYGTLGDVYTPVNVQIAGIYPAIVIVLVGLQRTMNDTTTVTEIVAERDTGSVQFTRDVTLYKVTSKASC